MGEVFKWYHGDQIRQKETDPASFYEKTAVGDILLFGQYMQKELEKQDVRWIVLKKENGKLLLLSEAILDYSDAENMRCSPEQFVEYEWESGYPIEHRPTWDNNPVCLWLNNDFYRECFSPEEQNRIQEVHVTIDSSKSVRNKVFLLSKGEREALLPEKYQMQESIVSDYALLRSGEASAYDSDATRENPDYSGIRPAICVSVVEGNDIMNLNEIMSRFLSAGQGELVKLGHFYQREYPWVEENLEWIVLSEGRNRKLLLSKNCVASLKMGGDCWDKCELRKWLNGTFLKEAFTSEEQKLIQQTNLNFKAFSDRDKPRSAPTMDKVFLLSVAEAERYLDIIQDHNEMSWWLREDCGRGDMDQMFAVCHSGYVGRNFGSYDEGVRPAIWVEM